MALYICCMNDDVMLNIRLPKKLRDQAHKLAQQEGVSLSELVRTLIQNELNRERTVVRTDSPTFPEDLRVAFERAVRRATEIPNDKTRAAIKAARQLMRRKK